jgi:RNA polymerase primary sigma factor
VKSGDPAAKEDLVMAFLPAIDRVAQLYSGVTRLNQSELRQEGVVGVLRAASRYEPERSTPFWAYASWWVRQAMQQLVAELTGPVVLSDRAARHLAQMKRARSGFQQANHREPSTAELGRAAKLSPRQVEDLTAIERTPRGLGQTAPAGEEATPLTDRLVDPDTDEDYERVEDTIEAGRLGHLMAGLDDRERRIVFAHFGIGCPRLTLAEIAAELGVSVERVRQIESRALEKLRAAASSPREDGPQAAATSVPPASGDAQGR